MKSLFFIFCLLILASCATNFHQAKKNNCLSPAANFYTLDALHYIDKTRYYRYHSGLGIFKAGKSMFIKELHIEDRCMHSIKLLEALEDSKDYKTYEWKNEKRQTAGKIKILKTIPYRSNYGNQVCRNYISFIEIEKKIRSYNFKACNYKFSWGPHDRYGYTIQPLVIFSGWRIYDLKYFKN